MIFNYIKRVQFSLLILIFSSNLLNAQMLDGVRIGGGVGGSYYWGTQSDFIPKLNTYGQNEFNAGYNLQIYKAIDYANEFGFRYLKTQLWSFKSENTQAIHTDLNGFSLMYQRSLNNNSSIKHRPVTFNLLLGLGFIQYSSIYYAIATNKEFIPISSVGNGYQPVPLYLNIKDKQIAATGSIGFNIGIRMARILSLYIENSFTLSGSNNITGNLTYKGKAPVNGYSYHALSLYFNLGNQKGKLGCPQF